jgi:CRISPR/Cas system CMR-associated protein Cmr5 small subunit
MDKKHQVHNLIILDESGSMESIKNSIISGFNEIVQTVKGIEKEFPEQEHFISLVSFNGLGQKLLHFMDPTSKLDQIDDARYKPDSLTPLYDAMGFAINKLKQVLEKETDYSVLVTILTDGAENASKEFSGTVIKDLIEELKLNRWTFTYIGADHDVEKIATSLSITNTMTFSRDLKDMKNMFAKESSARRKYSTNIRSKIDPSFDFYMPDVEEK